MNAGKQYGKKAHNAFAASAWPMALAFVLSMGSIVHASAQMSIPSPGMADGASPEMTDSMMEDRVLAHVRLDQFEGRINGSDSQFRWDGEGWIGTDMNKLWVKSEGFSGSRSISDGDHEAMYDHPIPRVRYFDGQVGVRADLDSEPHRAWAAFGVEGLAPGYFEFAPTLYIRDGGKIAGRVTGSCDLLVTQRLIMQPEAELNFFSKDDPARHIGSGLSDLDTGLRLRYEVTRKLAPYIGLAYNRKYGNTAYYSRTAGETTSDIQFVFGIRLWY